MLGRKEVAYKHPSVTRSFTRTIKYNYRKNKLCKTHQIYGLLINNIELIVDQRGEINTNRESNCAEQSLCA